MGVREECELYYKTQRQMQLTQLVLEPFTNLTIPPAKYEAFFHSVAGFFLVEHNVLETTKGHNTQGLVTKQWVDDLWETAVTEIARVISKQVRQY